MNLLKKIISLLLISALALSLSACGKKEAEPKTPEDRAVSLAKTFVANLTSERYAKCLENASSTLKTEIDEAYLASMWDFYFMDAGSFVSYRDGSATFFEDHYVCFITAAHTAKLVTYQITFSTENETDFLLEGIQITTADDPSIEAKKLPAGVIEEKVVIGEGTKYPLNGKLTLPAKTTGKIPAVVLVHDIGPQDMDETIYDNKPFRDIAYYLASKGIAVLRYDKSTYAFAVEFAEEFGPTITIDKETVTDAVYAKYFLLEDDRIDPDKIFVLGHGLGGNYAPVICAQGNYAGFIEMAGSSRSLGEILQDQALYMAQIGNYTDEQKAAVTENIKSEMRKYSNLPYITYGEAQEFTIFGYSAYYLKDMLESATNDYNLLPVPSLILQGTNDFQIFYDNDYEWQKVMIGANPQATFKLYDGLNHLFMRSTMENPDFKDYKPAGTVDDKVLKDIADWVLQW